MEGWSDEWTERLVCQTCIDHREGTPIKVLPGHAVRAICGFCGKEENQCYKVITLKPAPQEDDDD